MDGWPSLGGYTISVCNKPTTSTQPCIPPGSLNRVPASAGVRAGMSPARWQVTLCDPMWHVSSRSGVATCKLLYTFYLLTYSTLPFDGSIDHLQNALGRISSWMAANLTLNSSKTEFLLIGHSKQVAKIHSSSLNTTQSARHLGVIFDEHFTFSDQISYVSKSCYYHIRQLPCIRPYLNTKTASTITTSIVYCKLG